MIPSDAEVESFLHDAFEQNFDLLKLESGHALTTDIKDLAWHQVLYYWRKLRDIATHVTDTEVRLNLPNQVSPDHRKFGIEGVVDIVREADKTVMYDIKTHDADLVRENLPDYEGQLNVYAYIWKTLRGQPLDLTTIIATAYPESLNAALKEDPPNPAKIKHELEAWDPLVEIEYDHAHVTDAVADFGTIVDCIEDSKFEPPSIDRLHTRYGSTHREYASSICRYCDARFSCSAYREYALSSAGRATSALRTYLTDYGTDLDVEDRLTSSLDELPSMESLE